jgi:hypothetical protein
MCFSTYLEAIKAANLENFVFDVELIRLKFANPMKEPIKLESTNFLKP